MQERLYVLSPDDAGWRVTLNGDRLGLFPTKEAAFAMAVAAARRARVAGHSAWVKVRQREIAPTD
jgi:hypothetical protein